MAERDEPAPAERLYFDRRAAADWYVAKGLTHYTRQTLANLAHKGTGPAYQMIGARAFYELKELEDWLPKAFSKPKEGCGPMRTGAPRPDGRGRLDSSGSGARPKRMGAEEPHA